VDYAGLFPPAGLAMNSALENFARHQHSDHAWLLGRFICPATRLTELAATLPSGTHQWKISALAGTDLPGDLTLMKSFNEREAGSAEVDVVELKTENVSSVRTVATSIPNGLTAYCEIPVAHDPGELLAAIAGAGLRAKIRTGGITPATFPTSTQVARFLTRCAEATVPFKATAGLHHPLRGEFRLTYEPDSARATMHGFLGVFLAAAFARTGWSAERLVPVIEETQADAFEFGETAISWRCNSLTVGQIESTRRQFAISFGSCSFEEPVEDLKARGLL